MDQEGTTYHPPEQPENILYVAVGGKPGGLGQAAVSASWL